MSEYQLPEGAVGAWGAVNRETGEATMFACFPACLCCGADITSEEEVCAPCKQHLADEAPCPNDPLVQAEAELAALRARLAETERAESAERTALQAALSESEAREQALRESGGRAVPDLASSQLSRLREAAEEALSYLERVREPFGLRYESECDPLIAHLGQALAAAQPATAEATQ